MANNQRTIVGRARWIPLALCVPLGVLASIAAWLAIDLLVALPEGIIAEYPELSDLWSSGFIPAVFKGWAAVSLFCAGLFLVSALAGLLFKHRYSLYLIRWGYTGGYLLWMCCSFAALSVTDAISSAGIKTLAGQPVDEVVLFFLLCKTLWVPTLLAALILIPHILSWRRSAINHYTGDGELTPPVGDRLVENVRTHGKDPRFRKSTLSSVGLHVFVLILLPLFLRMGGCVKSYRPPFGGGQPVITVVKMVQPREQEKRQQFILAPNSAIIFKAPDLDDSKLLKEVEEDTKLTYVADVHAAHGNLGDGKAGTPGWQDGFKDGVVRFIRLEYNVKGWDDGMDTVSRADMNFLEMFRELSGGIQTAKDSEHHPIRLLRKYPKGQAPPFIYMTGESRFTIPESDVKILREFLQEGSLLFADCGSREWDRSFRDLMLRVFPGNPLRLIADDDVLYQIPFVFPNGAPPLWHHGGDRAMGIKIKNRWVVFYHPGDINDAWKTGHSGIDPQLALRAHQVGINVVYYSFMRYFEHSRKYEK